MTNDEELHDAFSYLDPATAINLDRYGLPGHIATASIDSDGSTALWIANLGALAHDPSSATYPIPPHEHDGPLPTALQVHLHQVPIRCGRPTNGGTPCQRRVAQPGPCHHHTDTARRKDPQR